MERRLAAIFAADMVAYSRLMEADEGGTLRRQKNHRAELIDPTITEHNGNIVKLTGDGMIAEFASVVDAVQCAVSIQRGMKAREFEVPEERKIRYRVGINLGDVIFDEDDIFGDGVNIASRLESLAEPGGIIVSGTAFDHLKSNIAVGYEDLGEQTVKNIATPVRAYRVVLDASGVTKPYVRRRSPLILVGLVTLLLLSGGWWIAGKFITPRASAAIDADQVLNIAGPVIAALPFENLSGDETHDLFARGMTEQLAAALTRFNGVRVLSPRAVAKHSNDFDALRREFGADYLLEASIRRGPGDIRITATLTKIKTGNQIWTDNFKVEVRSANIAEVQDLIAGKIAGATADEKRGLVMLDRVADQSSALPDDLSNLDCVVLSRWSSRTAKPYYECLTAALKLDPSFATGWARLAELLGGAYGSGRPLSDDPDYDELALMLEAAREAVRLAPDSAQAHGALAQAYHYNGDRVRFAAAVAKSLELNPNDAGTIGWLGTLMAWSGRWVEGAALAEKALRFNTTAVPPTAWYALAKGHYLHGEYSEALEDFQHVWNAYPGFWINDLNRAYLYADWGKQEESEKAAAAILAQRPDFVVEDAVEIYRRLQFEQEYLDKMARALKKAGLPSRDTL